MCVKHISILCFLKYPFKRVIPLLHHHWDVRINVAKLVHDFSRVFHIPTVDIVVLFSYSLQFQSFPAGGYISRRWFGLQTNLAVRHDTALQSFYFQTQSSVYSFLHVALILLTGCNDYTYLSLLTKSYAWLVNLFTVIWETSWHSILYTLCVLFVYCNSYFAINSKWPFLRLKGVADWSSITSTWAMAWYVPLFSNFHR